MKCFKKMKINAKDKERKMNTIQNVVINKFPFRRKE